MFFFSCFPKPKIIPPFFFAVGSGFRTFFDIRFVQSINNIFRLFPCLPQQSHIRLLANIGRGTSGIHRQLASVFRLLLESIIIIVRTFIDLNRDIIHLAFSKAYDQRQIKVGLSAIITVVAQKVLRILVFHDLIHRPTSVKLSLVWMIRVPGATATLSAFPSLLVRLEHFACRSSISHQGINIPSLTHRLSLFNFPPSGGK